MLNVQRLSFPTSHLCKRSQFINPTLQRYGFSSTASPEPNDKESNQSSDDKETNGDSAVPDETQDTGIIPESKLPEFLFVRVEG